MEPLPKEGEIFLTEDGDELRIEAILEIDDESDNALVRAEDGLTYVVERIEEGLEGTPYESPDEPPEPTVGGD
jgi:hypothetical protein